MEPVNMISTDHDKIELGGTISILDESKSFEIENTIAFSSSTEKYKSWGECKSTSILSIPDEPKSYKMEDISLLELNEEDWKSIWEEHIQFRDAHLKKLNFDGYKHRLNGLESAHSIHYIDSIHHNFKLIKLERRLQKLES